MGGEALGAAADGGSARPPVPGSARASVGGVVSAALVPLHVPNAPHRLDLGVLGAKLGAVFVVTLLKQVLVASVARVLIAHPPAGKHEA